MRKEKTLKKKYHVRVCFWDIEAESVKEASDIVLEDLPYSNVTIMDVKKVEEAKQY